MTFVGRRAWQIVLALALVAVVVWALVRWLPPAFDFSVYFRPAVWYWLHGQSPYVMLERFFNPPWVLLVILPFALPPEPIGRALLLIFSLVVVMGAVSTFRRRRLATVLILLSFPCLSLVWHGQLDALIILGVWLGCRGVWQRHPWMFSAGLLLMSLKPQETVLVIVLLLWNARHWTWGEWLRVAALPVAVVLWTVVAFRVDWVSNLIGAGDISRGVWVNVSWWWRVWGQSFPGLAVALSFSVSTLGLALTMPRPLTPYTLALVVTANMVASPYVEIHHLLIPLVLAWPWLLDRQPLAGLLVYLATFSPLIRLSGNQELNVLDFVFPVVLMLTLLLYYNRQCTLRQAQGACAAMDWAVTRQSSIEER